MIGAIITKDNMVEMTWAPKPGVVGGGGGSDRLLVS